METQNKQLQQTWKRYQQLIRDWTKVIILRSNDKNMTEIAFKIELLFGERVCGALETITPMECQKGKISLRHYRQ